MFAVALLSLAVSPPPAASAPPFTLSVGRTSPARTVTPPPLAPPVAVGPVVGVVGGPPPVGTATRAPLMPNNGLPVKFQQACPGDVAQPFQRRPRVTTVEPCQTGEAPPAGATSQLVWAAEFDQPAHVPIPRYDTAGKAVCDTDGLLIYEGMRLTVDAGTGTYDLAFTATVPGQLTVLRLQLLLDWQGDLHAKQDDYDRSVAQKFTLTLPPIRLEPLTTANRGDTDADTFHVHHRGYSSRFLGRWWTATGNPPARFGWTVSRNGTARFGSPVAVDETNR